MLPEELMKKVRQLQIHTSRAVNELFAGEYSSAFKGRGMEFAEVREYAPGDDVRTIDWNVTARMSTPYVKRFVEERELTVMLTVDLSASGTFGSIDKLKNELAAELSAVLAFAAVRSNDKVGLLIFTDRIEHFVPPKKGSHHVLRVIRELLDFEPHGHATDINGALEHLIRVLKKRSVVVLVSDFLTPVLERREGVSATNGDRRVPEADWETSLRILNRRHDVIAAAMIDPRERDLPPVGLMELRDPETGRLMRLDTSSGRVRREFKSRALARERELEERMRRCGVDFMKIVNGEPYLHTILELFRRRERRR